MKYLGNWQSFILPLKKRITQLEDTINEEDKIIRDKYTLN